MLSCEKKILEFIIIFMPVMLLSMQDPNQSLEKTPMVHLAIFVSGRGSNMEAILAKKIERVKPCVVISNKSDALALKKAQNYRIPAVYIDGSKENNKQENYTQKLINCLKSHDVTPENGLICLAGFMKVLDADFVRYFKNKILNIHPSLLPAFPGLHAVKQALEYGSKVSGCTINFVDEGIDTGVIVKQATVEVEENDTVESLEARIQTQEHKIYPEVIELFAQKKIIIEGRKVRINS
jgi:phosphoribosylglycinamide formyltransferase 1